MDWVNVSNGKMGLRGRPGKRFVAALGAMQHPRIVTLLSEREGALSLGEQIKQAGSAWTWLPLENGKIPHGKADAMLRESLPILADYLAQGETILIHCAAGVHRTGMVAYALLRYVGLTCAEAVEHITQMRALTADELTEDRMKWADQAVADLKALAIAKPQAMNFCTLSFTWQRVFRFYGE